jgi:flagellar biosynthesis/type III secretory pathway protein FliH
MNNIDSQPPPLIYNHEEVRLLLENAKLKGWQEGFEEGHRTGRKTGHEEGKEDGYKEGYEAREKLGQEKEEKAWRK